MCIVVLQRLGTYLDEVCCSCVVWGAVSLCYNLGGTIRRSESVRSKVLKLLAHLFVNDSIKCHGIVIAGFVVLFRSSRRRVEVG